MQHLKQKYQEFDNLGALREYSPISTTTIDFTTSDYLNIANSNNLEIAVIQSLRKYGLGAKGSNAVCGYTQETKNFEIEFAKFVDYPCAIFFSSGYMANLAVYSTLFNHKSTLFADKNIHASIIDGIQLSQAKLKRFAHQDFSHLANIYDDKSFIISEGIFSTNGAITDLSELTKHSQNIIIDEAHSFGILGKNGRGSINHHKLNHKDIQISIYPLGKAFGSVGAMVCTNIEIANYLRQFARNYIYTTALPPMIISANIMQLENLRNANSNRQKLHQNIIYFNKIANEYSLHLINDDISPIRSIVFDNNQSAIATKKKLQQHNISVSCFRYPTVPRNKPMLRFSLHSDNSFADIKRALTFIVEKDI